MLALLELTFNAHSHWQKSGREWASAFISTHTHALYILSFSFHKYKALMLHDEEDPLSSSIFNIGNASSSFFGTSSHATNGLTTSFFSPHYDDDPWSTAIVEESRPIQQTFHPPPPAPPPSMSTTPAVTASVDNHDTLFEPSLSTVLSKSRKIVEITYINKYL